MATRPAVYDEVIALLRDHQFSREQFESEKRKIAHKHGLRGALRDIDIFLHATREEHKWLRVKTKPVRSIAGVAPVAIMSAPIPCPHGKCRMCPDHLKEGIPMSYTGREPATMRGIRAQWDAFEQVFSRLEQYVVTGHTPQKCDVIVMGGTFPSYPIAYQVGFMRDMFAAMNAFSELFYELDATSKRPELNIDAFKEFFELPRDLNESIAAERVHQRIRALKEKHAQMTLEEAQLMNETSVIRCIGCTFETRPDAGLLPHGNLMLRLGGTRVELGVQSVYDECLHAVYRAHDSALTKRSIQVLRDLGFKMNFHIMPGMPETMGGERLSYEKDLTGLQALFSDPAYRPDMLKLYPCMVMPNTPLLEDYNAGKFHPMGTEEAARLLQEFLPSVQPYCRIMRVQRDIPTYRTVAGVGETNLRQRLDEHESQDIRAREIGTRALDSLKPEIIVIEYEASGGTEFFISYEDTAQRALVGYCRLRFPAEYLRVEITPSTAIIRELHVYGEAAALRMHSTVQHRGVGTLLMHEAERIARERGKDKMVVISGVGVREYYCKKHGYAKEGPYVMKTLEGV